MDLIDNPYLFNKKNISRLNYSLRGPMGKNLLLIANDQGMLILKEYVTNRATFRRLQMFTRNLCQIMCIDFSQNPIGGHPGLNKTIVCICLRFFWPGLYTYVKRMIGQCAGCQLADISATLSKCLMYSFPNDTTSIPILHINGCTVGSDIHFSGNKNTLLWSVLCSHLFF